MSTAPPDDPTTTGPTLAARYLKRLSHPIPTCADLPTLQSLLTAHLLAIPFENLSSFTGTPVSVDPPAVYTKLLESRRGGYCVEHATLSSAALAALGFTTRRALARVYVTPGAVSAGAQSHCVTVVSLPGAGDFVFDPGFGRDTPTLPLNITSGPQAQVGAYGTFRVVAPQNASVAPPAVLGADAEVVVERSVDGGRSWMALYGLTAGPVVDADVVAFNWFVATYPDSIFVTTLRMARFMRDELVVGLNASARKKGQRGDVLETYPMRGVADLGRMLREGMTLEVDDALVERVWARLVEVGAVERDSREE